VTLETLEYDRTLEEMLRVVRESGGYVQNSRTTGAGALGGGSYYTRNASFTLRVPAENLESFNALLGELGSVTSEHVYVEEVTDYYYDLSSRLEALEIQRDRLEEMLANASSVEEMIVINDSLSGVQYEIENTSVVSGSWSDWYGGNMIDLSLSGLQEGTSSIEIRMLASGTDQLLCTGVLYVEVADQSNACYSGYYPTPDFAAVTGVPLYYHEDGCYFYRYVDMANIDVALDRYETALYNNGFEYWKEVTDSYGDPIIYYTQDSLDLYVYIAINYIDGYICIEICPYYGWEV